MSTLLPGQAEFQPHTLDWALAPGSNADQLLLGFLVVHAAASVLLALLAVFFLPPGRDGKSRRALGLLFFAVIYAIPGLGLLGVVAGIALSRYFGRQGEEKAFRVLEVPELDSRQPRGGGFRAAGLRSFLANGSVSAATRLRALVALQNVPGRVAVPVLRDALADHSEDIRLLAYGMVDGQEKRLNRAIHAEGERFAQAPEGSPGRLDAARRLSDLYWEMVYQGLAQGDLRTHALEQSLHYCRLALAALPGDGGLLLRLGRLLQELGEAGLARYYLERALAQGLPEIRILPYLAETAFRQGNYGLVRRLMAAMDRRCSVFRLRPLIHYWGQS